ncbi:sugar ABC transporter substrate-binding protein [Pullulanibacillus sp. KACC 23026]|uniref:sugar ABC transporter substrate-binding protein n=1 Tax=Pullulanibacillus sp. KACC 23026 TaxID=3028315 RepID=UPI0023B132A9|nr:sugar ABC transporter substrate-binding protein [Pullulanibacillus sp. KACC 23026]WEG14753.1 sugar ABC transporter substrate-binding protein [Pullulanibacillus sp. KACC 23026]
MNLSVKKVLSTSAAMAIAASLLVGCGTSSTSGKASSGSSAKKSNQKVALLLPDTTSSARYESEDKPDFIADMKKLAPNAKVDYQNAQADAATQEKQAEAEITNGATVLVVDPVDSTAAATIVTKAHQAKVKVISYDRMISGPVDYYVSFDNEKVGELQGQYIADNTKKGGTVVMLNGAQTDPNALQFAQGAHKILDPLFKNGTLKKGYETYTPNWDPANGLREMQQALTKLNNNVDAVLSANDGLAGAAIQALSAQKLAGKVPVTGQDATDAGLHDIMQGTQGMTVYKAVPTEAKTAAEIAADLVTGKQVPSSLVSQKVKDGSATVPAVLLTPVVVTKDNIQDTVIKDGYTTMDKINNPGK